MEDEDGRFQIEPQSGTWVIVDTTQTNEFGLPLVRGPFGSLTARSRGDRNRPRRGTVSESPLAERIQQARQGRPGAAAFRCRVAEARRREEDCGCRGRGRSDEEGLDRGRRGQAHGGPRADEEPRCCRTRARAEGRARTAARAEVDPRARGRPTGANARRLIERLRDLDISDPEGLARAEFAQREPAVARVALERQLRAATRSSQDAGSRRQGRDRIILAGKDDDSTLSGDSRTVRAARSTRSTLSD